ncbi:WD domain containing protein [Musa troglodytarum]|uniref:WD domain containing protein n=1 Tax=Musa troglodytarum TaxID=320322 RepID=A0A9E7FB94_9LILI|nr:WD domain containing protein [Musa troglodytarum]
MHRVLKSHEHPVTALHLTSDLKQLLSGDSSGNLLSWILLDDSLRASYGKDDIAGSICKCLIQPASSPSGHGFLNSVVHSE